jgi:hypothetical protein
MTKKFWKWPSIIRELTAELHGTREAFIGQQNKASEMETLAVRATDGEHRALRSIEAQRTLAASANEQLCEALADARKLSATVSGLEDQVALGVLENERIKAQLSRTEAEVEKTKAALERAELATEQEKIQHDKTKRLKILMAEWIFKNQGMVIPPEPNGFKSLFMAGKNRLSILLMLLLPIMAFAQGPPPPLLRNPYTTNGGAWSQTNIISLSTTNATSKPLTNRYRDGVLTLFGLEAGSNIGLSHNGSNIVITGSGGAGSLTTNANQFGTSVELTLKSGAFQTNMNFWGIGTNHGNIRLQGDLTMAGGDINAESIFPNLDDNYFLGGSGSSWNQIYVKSAGLNLTETGPGNDVVRLVAPAALAASYTLTMPNVQGANGQIITNNGSGALGWWTPSTGDSGGTNARQFGTLLLTNLSNNPYTGYTNQVFGGTNISVRTSGGTNFIDTTGNLNNWSQIPTGSMANVVSTTYLTNWANSISNRLSGTNVAWVEMTGSDATGQYGDRTKPFRTIWAAISNTFTEVNPPWMINVGAGSFTNGDVSLIVSNGCWILGSGRDATEIVSNHPLDTNGVAVWPRDNSRLYNLTINQLWTNSLAAPIGSYGFGINVQSGFTNVYTYGCRFLGKSDNLYVAVTAGPCIMTNDSCLFDGGRNSWDLVATAGHTNSVWTFNNCLFTTYGPAMLGATTMRMGNLFEGTNIFNHCTIICDGAASTKTEGLVMHNGIGVGTPKGQLEINDCWLYTSALSGTVTDIVNTVSGVVIVRGPFSTNNCIGPITQANYPVLYNKFGPGAFSQVGITNVSTNGNTMTTNSVGAVQPVIALDFVNGVTGLVSFGTSKLGVALNTNVFQPATANLTNWSLIPTGAMANVVSTTFLTNWANAVSNYVTAATNSASVTNWINSRQPASANLTNWSLIPTGEMANVVSTTFLTNWANAISNLTQTKTALTTNANQFGASIQLTIKDGVFLTNIISAPTGGGTAPALTVTNTPGMGTNSFQVLNTNGNAVIFASTNGGITLTASNVAVLGTQTNTSMLNVLGGVTNWAAFQVKGTTDHAGSITNEGRMDTAGGVTNWIQTEVKGTLYASSNLLVKAGQSTSNVWAGGTYYWSTTSFTNLNGTPATFTNLGNVSIAAHVLTNNGDTIRATWGGRMQLAKVNTNNFKIVFGSETILDTGLQIASNCNFKAEVIITRTGNTSQHAEGWLAWGPNSVPFVFTNSNIELVQTNGIATTLALQGASQAVGAHTNNSFRVYFDPAVR